ncbi:transposase [bacterium AH-315-K03]|nr:transposase [bacterium AH-315-K03]
MIERILSPEKLDVWFGENSDKQYARELLFSTLFDLMGMVVFKVFPSVNSAYQSKAETISVSVASIYNKLSGIEISTISSLVQDTSNEMAEISTGLKAQRSPLLAGYKTKMLDGNCIETAKHRLKALRDTKAGPLLGKSLIVYDHELDLASDIFPCEDGHAQERSLLHKIIPTVCNGDVWVADRNFCVQDFLSGINLASAHYVIRRHKNLPTELQDEPIFVGDSDTGEVYEQAVKITDSNGNNACVSRLITIKLKKSTRSKDNVLEVITNLPIDVDAISIAGVYRKRWSIETMFQHLTTHLKSEINTLGYPKAALFGFSISLVVYNLLSVIKAAMRSIHGEEKIEEEVSGYYVAGEISRSVMGMEVALPADERMCFREMSLREFTKFLKKIMKNVVLSKYKKHKRGPKKTTT